MNTYSDTKLFYYKYTSLTEVWGNRICKIKFYNLHDEVVYSRNVWYHHLNVLLKKELDNPIFVDWLPASNIAIVYEFERSSAYDLVVIDFDKKKCLEFHY